MAAHQDILITFEVEDRRYEAVGFIREGETSVDGDEMLRRTAGKNGGAIGEEDVSFLRERRGQLPDTLRPYWLVTGQRDPDNPRYVSYLYFYGIGWCQGWNWLGHQWNDYYLVVRRCS